MDLPDSHTKNSPLDFEKRQWNVENGSKGKMPVSADEFKAIGLDSDAKGYLLLKFVYARIQK